MPAGWVEWTDWSCDCRFYIPGSKDVMPAPIVWEPCLVNPGGEDCKLMRVDWTEGLGPIGGLPSFERNPDGSGLLMFRRAASAKGFVLDLVADVDGSVRNAILEPWGPESIPGCFLLAETLRDGRFLHNVRGHNAAGAESESRHDGVLGGAVDELVPTVFERFEDENNYSWYHSSKRVVRLSVPFFEMYTMPWAMEPETLITSPPLDPENLVAHQELVVGDTVFWHTGTSYIHGINVWDPVHGARPFIRFVGDYTRGAGDLGTDGVDLVWTYGEGMGPDDFVYPLRSIMTAPYTNDPAAVARTSRRLRSAPDKTVGLDSYAVGCGYAAHVGAGAGYGTLVVRIADGVSWHIAGASAPKFHHERPVGITCTDVFVLGIFDGKANIARFRLDSLGAGIAPD